MIPLAPRTHLRRGSRYLKELDPSSWSTSFPDPGNKVANRYASSEDDNDSQSMPGEKRLIIERQTPLRAEGDMEI